MKFTLNRIAGLRCPPGKRDMLVFDAEQRGLGVRVMASGGKSYLAQYTWHGKKRRIPIGSCSSISLAKAREAVRAIMGDVARGIDPATERKKKAAGEALTLRALLADWRALHPGEQAAGLCRRGRAGAAPCLPPASQSSSPRSHPGSRR